MYERPSDTWMKHLDFIVLDLLCIQIAYVLAFAASGYGFDPYEYPLYRVMAIYITLFDFLPLLILNGYSDVLRRGAYRELVLTLRQAAIVGTVSLLFLFLTQEGQNFSRLTLVLTFVFYSAISYCARMGWKTFLRRKSKRGSTSSLLIITTAEHAPHAIKALDNVCKRFTLHGLVVLDKNMVGQVISNVKVVANRDEVFSLICQEWIDEVLITVPSNYEYPGNLVQKIAEAGIVVHYEFTDKLFVPGMKQFMETIGEYNVVTTTMNYASSSQLLAKRIIDVVAGILGCLATGVIAIFIGPLIYLQSPGPIFFAQERVGKNGRRFKMYKFRSMYPDAEQQKKSLTSENKLSDEKMFKMDFDPRVIGNVVTPDGTRRRGIGDLIRRTSLDEFPQFFNVLKGEMSVVGTRPPLVSEAALYESQHRARLAIKPGITGMWQVSGRSNITDFDEVVRLDKEYINNWSIKLDMKILLKTVSVVMRREGSA